MNLLAFDTSSVACSVALQVGEAVMERHEEQAREHTRLLAPMIRELMAEAGVTLAELDAIVLGNGPGSFIGMRIAASVAQGLAHGAGLGIVPVSSLAAVAAEAFVASRVDEAVVTQDAHMNEVYLGAFRRGADGVPEPLFPERLHDQTPITELERAAAGPRVAAGAGWERYPALWEANSNLIDEQLPCRYPRARHLLGVARKAHEAGRTIAPQDLVPAYLRSKVAATPGPGAA